MLKCPKCGGTNIGQYRMLTGAIWCEDCKFEALEKEKNNPFIYEETRIKLYKEKER